ncbi:VOC family protein [Novosphingobium sp. M1R2S20]|uniref:VOC family protein n=1 Tax=Novosphingobium rhizovicinum TaxID=3228928 RepID=A0ABV3RE25_9SPHN
MKAIGIDHVVLRVSDLERSMAFYRDVLGLTLDRRRDDLGLIHMRAGCSFVDLVDVAGELGQRGGSAAGAQRRNMDHLCLRVENFDETRIAAELEALGVTIGEVDVRYGATGDGVSMYLTDPDGNGVEIRG